MITWFRGHRGAVCLLCRKQNEGDSKSASYTSIHGLLLDVSIQFPLNDTWTNIHFFSLPMHCPGELWLFEIQCYFREQLLVCEGITGDIHCDVQRELSIQCPLEPASLINVQIQQVFSSVTISQEISNSGSIVKQPLFWAGNLISVKFHALEFATSAMRCIQRSQWNHKMLTSSAKWAFLFASANSDNTLRLPPLSQISEWQQESTMLRMVHRLLKKSKQGNVVRVSPSANVPFLACQNCVGLQVSGLLNKTSEKDFEDEC